LTDMVPGMPLLRTQAALVIVRRFHELPVEGWGEEGGEEGGREAVLQAAVDCLIDL